MGCSGPTNLSGISGGSTASFQYDAFGRRVGKTVNGVTTGFVYDEARLVQELIGSTPTATMLTGFGLDEVFARSVVSGSEILLTDAVGSTLALADSSGAVTTQYTFETFGSTTVAGAASGNALQFTGRENDGTGIYFYRARYYDPARGRFLSEDPLRFRSDENFYRYVYDNPTGFSDPTGEAPVQAEACCDGAGGFMTCWNPNVRRPQNPRHVRCIEEHEADHGRFMTERSCGNPCEGKERGFKPRVPLSQQAEMECRGYAVQAACLMRGPLSSREWEEARMLIEQLRALARAAGWRCNDRNW